MAGSGEDAAPRIGAWTCRGRLAAAGLSANARRTVSRMVIRVS